MYRSLSVVVAGFIATAAFAQTPANEHPDRFDERYSRQMQRIEQGQKSGQLTTEEADRLRQREARLKDMHNKMAADGKVTPEERRRMHRAMEKQSREIARERHDRQHDFNHDGKVDRPREHRNGKAERPRKGAAG